MKNNNIKIFVDTDDAFGELDTSHPQYELQKERVEALEYVIRHADETWVSTEKLRKSYETKKIRSYKKYHRR